MSEFQHCYYCISKHYLLKLVLPVVTLLFFSLVDKSPMLPPKNHFKCQLWSLMPNEQKKANGYPPSPLDSGSASLLPPSAGAEYWWLPAPPPTWRVSESVKAPKTFHPTWLALSSSKSESQSSYKRQMFIRLWDYHSVEIKRGCHIESEIGHGIQYYTQWTD